MDFGRNSKKKKDAVDYQNPIDKNCLKMDKNQTCMLVLKQLILLEPFTFKFPK